jgi:hypothetical protein
VICGRIGSTAPELLARKSILVTLLTACGHESARAAFTQVEDIGERWFRELFEGIANYVRESTFNAGGVLLRRARNPLTAPGSNWSLKGAPTAGTSRHRT